jgi:hypothetical protein
MVVWFDALLAKNEETSGSTAAVLLGGKVVASEENPTTAPARGERVSGQALTVSWHKYHAWRRGRPANPRFASSRPDLLATDEALQATFAAAYALRLAVPLLDYHHNVLVHAVRLGLVEVRSFDSAAVPGTPPPPITDLPRMLALAEIGRASCRERVY